MTVISIHLEIKFNYWWSVIIWQWNKPSSFKIGCLKKVVLVPVWSWCLQLHLHSKQSWWVEVNHFAWLLRARSIRIVSLIVSPFESTTIPYLLTCLNIIHLTARQLEISQTDLWEWTNGQTDWHGHFLSCWSKLKIMQCSLQIVHYHHFLLHNHQPHAEQYMFK